MKDYYDVDKVRAYAELEISGPNLDLDYITRFIGLNITYIRRNGDNRSISRAGVVITPAENDSDISTWEYKTAEKGTYDTELQIAELIKVFRRKTKELKEIKELYKDTTMKVNVVIVCGQRLLPGNSVTAEQIRFLANIGVGLYYDIHHKPTNVIRCHKKPKLLPGKKEGNTTNGG